MKDFIVRNLQSYNNNPVPNQFEIITPAGVYFQSYDKIIVHRVNGNTFLDELYWDYSRTTLKYLHIFLGLSTKEIKDRIKCGIYKFKNLNDE